MKDEIKEILDNLKDIDKTSILKNNDAKIILNYITNLQQENMKLISENEAIKNIKYTVDEVISKSRIDKSIEYIENELFNGKDDLEWCRKNDGCISGSDLPADVILSLYDILKGDNNE